MIYTGVPYKIYYTALNYTSGLSDVYVTIINPLDQTEGPYLMQEMDNSGIYYYTYTPELQGTYLIIADCNSLQNKFSKTLNVVENPVSRPIADFD